MEKQPIQQMKAAVYRGKGRLQIEKVPVPEPGPGELLLEVHCCGVCGTDLKKIRHDLLPPPRIFGHEISGRVAALGAGTRVWKEGDRVVVHHHVPCGDCFYCRRRLHAHCPLYRRTGTTAGFEPAGGGFARFVKVADWVVRAGVVAIPEGVGYRRACFLEPVNTCLKGMERLAARPGDTLILFGLGSIGLILLQLARVRDCRVIGVDPLHRRREAALRLGAESALPPNRLEEAAKAITDGRGADGAILACEAEGAMRQALATTRPGARILIFAHTRRGHLQEVDLGTLCVEDKELVGSYSASLDFQEEAARLVFEGVVEVEGLVTHAFTLEEIDRALSVAERPEAGSLKVVVEPQQ